MLSSRKGSFHGFGYAGEKQRSESLNKVKTIGIYCTTCQAAHAFFCQCGGRLLKSTLTTTVINLIKKWPQRQSFEKEALHKTT